MKNEQLKNKILTSEQVSTVKEMIMMSMRDVYTNQGSLPGDGFNEASGAIADKIIENVQKSLIQTNVFAKAVRESIPKLSETQLKRQKITKKNARK